jgi:integrase
LNSTAGGYAAALTERDVGLAVASLLLASRSPRLEDVTPAALAYLPRLSGLPVELVQRGLVQLQIFPATLLPTEVAPAGRRRPYAPGALARAGVPAPWLGWCDRWHATSTLAPKVRRAIGYAVLRAGRWLAAVHPEVSEPGQWTRELAAEYVAAVDRMAVGEWSRAPYHPSMALRGARLSAAAKDNHLRALRMFFRDGQEWGWFPRRFDAQRAFATPPSVRALIGPKPRVIADDVWAKLLWAGLNLTQADLHTRNAGAHTPYPLAMVRAVAVTWLFAGLRSDELRRLRVGCVRWQPQETTIDGTNDVLPREAVCWLDVPVNKTATAFTKAVDRVVGEAIVAWELARPAQSPQLDPKTGELVQFLFAYRGHQLGEHHLNKRLIPRLCHKAGVPSRDARGAITSHRARSTIASQLANAREPMTLLELMEWLGHRDPSTTLHYVKVTPTRLAKAYADAGYFARNVRAVEVLIDQDVIQSGAATRGEP